MGQINLPLSNHVGANDDSMGKYIRAAGIHDRRNVDWYNKFYRFGYMDPYTVDTTAKEFVLFTKPDLHIFNDSGGTSLNDELRNLPIFTDSFNRIPEVLKQLQYSANPPKQAFVNLLSNTLKSTVDLPGVSVNEVQTSENIYGTYISYRRSSITADEQHEFSLEFEDTRYREVYMWFKLYDEYCKLKDLGMVTPPNPNYRIHKILHDQMSVFKIIVGDDGETIIYWAKLWGVFPKNVPRETFSDLTNTTNGVRFSVNFKSQFVDDMDPTILGDLNAITLDSFNVPAMSNIAPIYDKEMNAVSGEWVGLPFVTKELSREGRHIYKLKWRR